MAFILDGNDQLSPVFRRIGESADHFHRRINDAVEASGGELRAFTRGAGGQLQELGGNLTSAGQAAEALGQQASAAAPEVGAIGAAADDANESVAQFTRDSNGRIRDLRGRFVTAAAAAEQLAQASAQASPEVRDVGTAASSSSESTSRLGGNARRTAPRLAELGSAAGDAAVAVGSKGGGLGGAMGVVAAIAGLSLLPALGALVPMLVGGAAAAGTLKLGFSGIPEAMEAAGKGKKEYAAALKGLTPEARAFTKELVSTKREFAGLGDRIQKVMLPGFTTAVKEAGPLVDILGDSMVRMGKGFGDAAAGAGRLMKDSGFKKDFSTVLQLGNVFVRDLTGGLGGLARGFLQFGAASGPTLKSLSSGISDLLGKGLPGMFQGLERGIGGSSKFLDGLFGMINQILPAIGRLSGEVARTFGPFLGEQMTLFGKVATNALDALAIGARLLKPVFDDLTFGLKALMIVGGIMADSFKAAGRAIVNAFLPSLAGVKDAQGPLQRLHRWVEENKIQFMELGRQGANAMITITEGALNMLPEVIRGFRYLAMITLGVLDGILGGAIAAFGWIPGLGPKLQNAGRDFDQFKQTFVAGLQVAENQTRAFSNSVLPRLRENRLQMNISSWQAQIAQANRDLKTVPPEKRAAILANKADLERKVAGAKSDLKSIRDETVYINVIRKLATVAPIFGYLPGFATGGLIRGPGTSTSDSVPRMLSDGEYVVRAAAVDRVGIGFLDALNEGRPGAPALGRSVGALAAAPRPAAASGMQVNVTVNGALDPLSTAQQIRKILRELQRNYGLAEGVIMA
ncbi:hypothetical protein AVW11_04065 [Streptomyces amritsarensis]|uniref:Uncharacterized protein n=2 Tax=Streptomyces amritsarensis TaxID=681158 RepID=A0ABX3GB68_9ACTN|nr:hypothetical protein AVW11_04065 [Streptomyces amritsarensis]